MRRRGHKHGMSLSPPILLALAERNVPRYTSYPTAPHFHAGIGAADHAAWLDALAPGATLSIYLHVPFCRNLCLYCGCHTKAVRRAGPVANYARHLEAEIDLVAARVGGRRLTHWHWGGGTPSILGADALRRLHARVARHFDLSALREHAIELDPRQLPDDTIAALADIGITRVSLGVQDFSAHVQEAIGRLQPFDQVEGALSRLRRAGLAGVNIDLMYGLPKQSVQDMRNTARLAASLGPQRIALFGYAHVPWFKTHQRMIDTASLPGIAERLEQASEAAAIFAEAGYVAIGIDHFARPDDALAQALAQGRLRRNFQGYTDDAADALIGLGASSIGRLPQGFVQNAVDIGAYGRAIADRRLATVKGLALGDADRLRGAIIERLMCDLKVDLGHITCGTRARLAFADAFLQIDGLAESGIVERTGNTIRITDRGRPLTRLIAACFDTYLSQSLARHSRAV